jgi:hypothetical protein
MPRDEDDLSSYQKWCLWCGWNGWVGKEKSEIGQCPQCLRFGALQLHPESCCSSCIEDANFDPCYSLEPYCCCIGSRAAREYPERKEVTPRE